MHKHRRISLRKPLRCGFTILLCSCLFAGAAECRSRLAQEAAQGVAEAARQGRARKEAKGTKHVYTEEDLRRAKILTADDEARVQARRELQPPPAEEQAQAPYDVDGQLAQLPLGDIARRYRNAKLAAEAPDPFHLPFDEPVFAAPVILVPTVAPPRPSFSPVHPKVAPAHPNAVAAPAIAGPAPLRRVDPFTRRSVPPAPPTVSRVAPAAPQPLVAPAIAPSSRLHTAAPAIAPPAPKSSSSAPVERGAPKPNPATSIAPLSPIRTKLSSKHTITIEPGDSLWKLSQEHLGRGSRWQELLAANPGIVDPARIAAGTEIVVPAKLTGLKSDLQVWVKQGDTLTKIAHRIYGHAAAWRCIAKANPEIADVNRIYAGQQLLLPFSCEQ